MSDEYTPTTEEVLVEGSWFKREELPTILGNYIRGLAESQRREKELTMTLTELRPVRDADTGALAVSHDREVAEKALKPVLDYANSPVTLEYDDDGDPLLSADYVEGTLGARQDVLRIIERNPYREGATE